MSGVEQVTVRAEEEGWRLDRWARAHYPTLGFGQLQKLCRTGQFRLDGKRIEASARLAPGRSPKSPRSWCTQRHAKQSANCGPRSSAQHTRCRKCRSTSALHTPAVDQPMLRPPSTARICPVT